MEAFTNHLKQFKRYWCMLSFLKLKINSDRIYGLDILRALAILFVVFGHGKSLYPEVTRKTVTFFMFDGVAIFFVLSGFLIGTILIKNLQPDSKTSLLNFWTRRWLRTLPNYFLILFVLVTLSVLYKDNFDLWYQKPYLTFTQNMFTHDHYFFSEAWSLSIEEWFYILIPLALFILVRVFVLPVRETIFCLAILMIIAVTWFRLNRYFEIPVTNIDEWDIHFRRQVSTRLDSLMFGVLGAAVQFYFQDFWLRYKKLFFVTGIVFLLVHQVIYVRFMDGFGMYVCVFSFTLCALGVLLILPLLSTLKSGSGKLFSFFSYISLISYSMYLLNYTLVKLWIVEKIPWDKISENTAVIGFLQPFSYWFLTIFLSLLLYKYFELPMMNLRDWKWKAKEQKVVVSAGSH